MHACRHGLLILSYKCSICFNFLNDSLWCGKRLGYLMVYKFQCEAARSFRCQAFFVRCRDTAVVLFWVDADTCALSFITACVSITAILTNCYRKEGLLNFVYIDLAIQRSYTCSIIYSMLGSYNNIIVILKIFISFNDDKNYFSLSGQSMFAHWHSSSGSVGIWAALAFSEKDLAFTLNSSIPCWALRSISFHGLLGYVSTCAPAGAAACSVLAM